MPLLINQSELYVFSVWIFVRIEKNRIFLLNQHIKLLKMCIRDRYKGHREIWHTGGTTEFISRASRFPDDDISLIMLTNYEGLPKNEMYERIAAEIFQV